MSGIDSELYNLDKFTYWMFFDKITWDSMNPFGFDPIRILFIAKSKSGKSWVIR
jgi:hypothetical protein